jgi:opacity protein-like surface antigen
VSTGIGGNVTLAPGINLATVIQTTGGPVTGTAAVPAQNITVAATTVPAVTVPAQTIPGQTIPGQTTPVLVNGVQATQAVITPATMTVTRTVAVDTKIDELASLRGRIGFVAWDNALFYGTGGLALAHASATSTITQTIGALPAQISSSSATGTMLGWALGVGVDYKFTPNWFVGVEYLHSDFPKNTFAFVDGKGGGFSLGNEHLQVDAVKARVGFLFN